MASGFSLRQSRVPSCCTSSTIFHATMTCLSSYTQSSTQVRQPVLSIKPSARACLWKIDGKSLTCPHCGMAAVLRERRQSHVFQGKAGGDQLVPEVKELQCAHGP